MPVLTDDQHQKLLEQMRNLPPLRNINAMHAWLWKCRPDLAPMFEAFSRDAAGGNKTAGKVILLMMVAFASGRAYQEANPEAPRDPDGYGA